MQTKIETLRMVTGTVRILPEGPTFRVINCGTVRNPKYYPHCKIAGKYVGGHEKSFDNMINARAYALIKLGTAAKETF